MNKQDQIHKLIEEALGSVDDIKRAAPRPFLLTRINASMHKGAESAWEKAGWFIGRPAVAFTGLCLVLLVNVMVILFNNTPAPAAVAEQVVQAPADEFSYTVATIYDIENIQP